MNIPCRVTHPARREYLHDAIRDVSGFAEMKGFSSHKILQIELVLEEILVNIINHAYPGGSGNMEIECTSCTDDKLVMVISDQGVPFNIIDVRDPDVTSDLEERKVGGLGIYFIKRMADNVSYMRRGNTNILEVSISKNIQ